MKLSTRVALASAVALGAVTPASADHGWASYHWAISGSNQPFEVLTKLSQPHWEQYVPEAVSQWAGNDDSRGSSTDYLEPAITGEASTTARKCNPTSGKITVCSDSYGFRGWLGIATIWANGSHIVQATTKLNDSYHNSGTYSSASWRRLVACQEIGHDFGLGHQNEDFSTDLTESCMEYTSAPAGNETPDHHDYQQLQIIYDAHMAEGSGGGDGGGGGKGPPDGKGPNRMDPFEFREVGQPAPRAKEVRSADWGTAVGFDAHGRPNVFALDLGKGLRKITRVTWVPGFRPQTHHLGDVH